MLNWNPFAPRNLAILIAGALIWSFLGRPLYNALQNKTAQ